MRKTDAATTMITNAAAAIASFLDTASLGAIATHPAQHVMTISPSKPLNLQRIDSPAAVPARRNRATVAIPGRPDQRRFKAYNASRQAMRSRTPRRAPRTSPDGRGGDRAD